MEALAVVPDFQMWATLLLAAVAVLLFVTEWLPLELTALALLSALLLLFHFFPLPGIDSGTLLSGFGNPALIAVLALLVVGEGLVMTGALDRVALTIGGLPLSPILLVGVALVIVAVVSAFLNNTPVVVIFIPILQSFAARTGMSASRVMMPLSFAAILGGMTTLIGSSTNLLVSSALLALGREPLGFFEFTVPGVALAAVGLVYVLLVQPRLLPDRPSLAARFGSGKQFVSQAVVPPDSPLVGERAVAGLFRGLPGVTVQMIERRGRAILPPFEDVAVEAGDVLVIAAPRRTLEEVATRHPGLLHPPSGAAEEAGGERLAAQVSAGAREGDPEEAEEVMAEAMVTPSSRLVGFTVRQIAFRRRYGCIVLGIQRRARMIRSRMDDIRLEPGDVLLVLGRTDDVRGLQTDRDLVVISGSAGRLPKPHHARTATVVFMVAVGLAAVGLVPIVVAAVAAASAMIAFGALNVRQAVRALDRKVVLLVASALALGEALQHTGGAAWLAMALLDALEGGAPALILSVYFLVIALATNLLSNNACAVLFTPIGVSVGEQIGVDPHVFAIATVFAANCSFATPIGYQTNLLVMGPGHYRFADFARAGLPLVLVMWVAFSLLAPMWWRL